MNDLSWLLYFADLSESLSTAFGWFVFFTLLFIAGSAIWFGVEWEGLLEKTRALKSRREPTKWDDGVPDPNLEQHMIEIDVLHKKAMRGVKVRTGVALFVGALFWVTAVALPTKETVLAIAASEMGEKVINTPTAGKAVKALDAWLDRQISPEPVKEETTDENK